MLRLWYALSWSGRGAILMALGGVTFIAMIAGAADTMEDVWIAVLLWCGGVACILWGRSPTRRRRDEDRAEQESRWRGPEHW